MHLAALRPKLGAMTAGAVQNLMMIAGIAGLAACAAPQGDEPDIVTEEQVAQRLEAAAPSLPQPGLYAIDILENGQPSARAPEGTRGCLTAQQLADPLQALVTGGRSDCAFGQFNFRGSRLEAAMVCTSDQGPQSITLSADYRRDGYDLDMTVGSGEDARTMTMNARRLGACEDQSEQQGSNL